MPRIGYLGGAGSRGAQADRVDGFLEGLRELGYIEGQTIAIEWRFSEPGVASQAQELAADLVRQEVDVIVVDGNTPTAQAAQRATRTIPIVAAGAFPVESGLVASLARPGGNLTGLSVSPPGSGAKVVDLFREVVPGLSRIAALVDPGNAGIMAGWEEVRTSAATAGLLAQRVDVHAPEDVEKIFESPAVSGVQAVYAIAGGTLNPVRSRLAELALSHRLPCVSGLRVFTEAGLLMSYGANLAAISRREAAFVDKIIKGGKPSELPVEQPTVFELLVNVNTLEALRMTIPPSVLPLVTEWIQ